MTGKTKMDDDPIVAEVRRIREEIAGEFNGDLRAMCEDARRQTEKARREGAVVASPSKLASPPETAKKAG